MKARLAATLACAALALLASGSSQAGPGKVVVLGFDGADPALVRKYMEEGALPSLQRLARQGTFKDLKVTNPPQTPVSWGAFMTGLNPGKNHSLYKTSLDCISSGSYTLLKILH